MAECRACKTILLAADLRERQHDGLLVCPECDFREPVKRVFVPRNEFTPPGKVSPVTVPPTTPPPAEWPPLVDMRRKPNYREPL